MVVKRMMIIEFEKGILVVGYRNRLCLVVVYLLFGHGKSCAALI